MNYKFLPPGHYLVWKIGAQGKAVRWSVTIGIVCAIIFVWYFLLHRPLLGLYTPSSGVCINQTTSSWHKELADLAQASEPCVDAELCIKNPNETALNFLQMCTTSGLFVQSCTCNKPFSQENIHVQRIQFLATGTMAQLVALFDLLAVSTIPMTNIECSLKKQHSQEYLITVIGEYTAA